VSRTKRAALWGRLRDPEGFLGPVLTLISGTAIAHGITAATLILLARLYSPADFGILGLFSSIVYTLSVAVCLRLDLAIIIPRRDGEAFRLVCLALIAAVGIALLSALVVLALPAGAIRGETYAGLEPFLWLLPVNLLAIGVFSALQSWFVRERAYGLLTRSRILQSAGASTTQIAIGAFAPSPLGLIVGFVMNSGGALTLLLPRFLRSIRGRVRRPGRRRLAATFRKYSDFPRYSVWEALANSASIQLPILLVGALTNASEVGQLVLAMSVAQAPLALFGNATAQVFMSQAPTRMRAGQLAVFTRSTLTGLAKVGGPMLLGLGVLAPLIFPLLFGDEWARSGILVAWMAPWLLLQFLTSPVSSVLNITGRLKLASAWQITGLVFRLGAVWVGGTLAEGASEAYCISGALFYAVYLYMVIRISQNWVDAPVEGHLGHRSPS
jgi:O-antigen/teichoic acid export membrane protein